MNLPNVIVEWLDAALGFVPRRVGADQMPFMNSVFLGCRVGAVGDACNGAVVGTGVVTVGPETESNPRTSRRSPFLSGSSTFSFSKNNFTTDDTRC